MRLASCKLNGRNGHEVGRELLRSLYWEETGKEMPEILVGKWGKPYFEGHKYHFSITHTREHVFCALSRSRVGIDAEEMGRSVPDSLVRRALSTGEQEQYLAAEDKSRAFLTFWVLKEAQAKYTGHGLRGFPNHTDFRLDDPRVQELDGCLLAIVE